MPLGEGSTVFYRGVPYVLRLETGVTALSLSAGEMRLSLPLGADTEKTLRKELSALFYPILSAACREREAMFALYGIPHACEIRQRYMKSMWGNCRFREKVLTFSTMLAAVPPDLLDYVICHEYAHLVHPDHSAAFYGLLSAICPDYKAKRTDLKKIQYERQ